MGGASNQGSPHPSSLGGRLALIKHKEVWVNLTDKNDRNTIVGTVAHALRRSALPESEVDEFREEAHKTPDLESLFQLCERWVRVTR